MAAQIEELQYRLRGIDDVSAPARKASSSLKQLGNQAKRSQIQMNQFGGAFTGVGKDMRKFALGGLQQAGYQIGDFAVQVANGTSKMQAFGQQAPQLLQIFGPLGSIAGAAVAIFAAFGVATEKMAGSQKKSKKTTDDLAASITAYKEATSLALASTAELNKKFGEYNSVLAYQLKLLQSWRAADAITAVKDSVSLLSEKMTELAGDTLYWRDILQDGTEGGSEDAKRLNEQLEQMAQKFGMSTGQLSIFSKSLENVASASSLNEVVSSAEAFTNLIKLIEKQTGQSLPPEIRKIATEIIKSSMAARELRNELEITATKETGNIAKVATGYGLYARTRTLNDEEFARLQIENHGKQIAMMGQTVALSKTYAQRQIQGYAEYYASRIAGENLVRNAQAETFRQAMIQRNRQQWIDEPSVDVAAARIQELKDKWADFKANLEKAPKVEKVAKEIKMQISPEVEAMERLANSMGQSFEDAFMSMIDGTKSAKDAFKDMTRAIIADLYRQFVVKQITGFIANTISAAFIPNVGAPSMGKVASADGGGYTGSGARSGGIDGRGGFPAILHPNETVIDHTKGQSGGGITVVQNINVSTGVQQTVRAEIRTLMPQIADAAKSAVVDAKRRGGSFGRAFS